MLRARLCQQLIIALCVRDTDSWLTVGVTDEKQNTVSSVGIDFSKWSEENGIDIVQGSVFCWDMDSGPTTDRDVVIAQLTVPKGASFVGTVNAQGQTKAGSKMKVWDKRAIRFHGGPETGSATCPALTISDATVDYDADQDEGDLPTARTKQASVTCNYGFLLQDGSRSVQISCNQENWVGNVPKCLQSCSALEVSDGSVHYYGDDNNHKEGDAASIKCDTNFKISDPEHQTVSCNNGDWAPSNTCVGSPSPPEVTSPCADGPFDHLSPCDSMSTLQDQTKLLSTCCCEGTDAACHLGLPTHCSSGSACARAIEKMRSNCMAYINEHISLIPVKETLDAAIDVCSH